MRINRLYRAEAIGEGVALPCCISLDERATHYLSKVLRLKAGAQITVFDGRGGEYLASIKNFERRNTVVELTAFNADNRSSPLQIQLVVGLSRGDRFDLVLQKATELGVSSVQPLLSQRSDRKPKANQLEKKQAHWQGVVQSACEQCGLNIVPLVHTPLSVDKWLASQSSCNGLLLHPEGRPVSIDNIRSMAKNVAAFTVAVGPEGGFSDEESDLLLHNGFLKLSLGARILRTETAPLAILSVLQYVAGDLSVC